MNDRLTDVERKHIEFVRAGGSSTYRWWLALIDRLAPAPTEPDPGQQADDLRDLKRRLEVLEAAGRGVDNSCPYPGCVYPRQHMGGHRVLPYDHPGPCQTAAQLDAPTHPATEEAA